MLSGSPFPLRVSPASLVHVSGEGLKDGILKQFRGEFRIESQAAGPGEIKIRMGGPRGLLILNRLVFIWWLQYSIMFLVPGGYQMKTIKVGRSLVCKYRPLVPGMYIIHVIWSGDPLPDSPFRVNIFSNKDEMRSFANHQSYS